MSSPQGEGMVLVLFLKGSYRNLSDVCPFVCIAVR